MSDRLKKLVIDKAPTVEKQVFCDLGPIGLASITVYLDASYIPGADLSVGEDTLDLHGYGTAYPLYMCDKIHVGYCFELPTSMTTIQKFLILISRERGKRLRLDKHTDIVYYDDMINVVSSRRNNVTVIAPNTPSTIRGISDGSSVS